MSNTNDLGRFDTKKIRAGIIKILVKNGVPKSHASILADCFIEADSCGVHSHGLSVFPAYIKKIQKNGYSLGESPEVIKETSAFSLVDAKNMIGAVSAKFCMDICINKCKESGIYTVMSRNSNTFGPAFYYAKLATGQKMIGICFSNSPAAMPAWNGNTKILGTNPFAFGIPGDKKGPILLDMATSVVAKSKINEARKAGKQIPMGWALDELGNPTTSPIAAINGMMLPMAEHKGYGIALIIDILAGLLSGAGYLNHINRFYSEDNLCMNVGHYFVAINPEVVDSNSFYKKVDSYIDELHSSGEKVSFPGERKLNQANESQNKGLPLTEEVSEKLEIIFSEYQIEGAFTKV